jgi:small-conductance mechanosensitive channel
VALQDFILAFVGWFILMGRTGIGVGDVVEINGVAGEVVDIGLFRTTLLETGNWTAKGHLTGRRVAFNNKYAISGQYFNFSTAGQWMWDEITVSVPSDEDLAATIERVQKTVSAETEADARQAELEWKQASLRHGLSQFSAESAVNPQPTATGLDLVVRYVTRASGRFERQNTLYQCVLDSLRAPKAAAAQR